MEKIRQRFRHTAEVAIVGFPKTFSFEALVYLIELLGIDWRDGCIVAGAEVAKKMRACFGFVNLIESVIDNRCAFVGTLFEINVYSDVLLPQEERVLDVDMIYVSKTDSTKVIGCKLM